MNEEIDRAILALTSKVTVAVQPDHALKYTQAALNLAHVKSLVEDREKKRVSA